MWSELPFAVSEYSLELTQCTREVATASCTRGDVVANHLQVFIVGRQGRFDLNKKLAEHNFCLVGAFSEHVIEGN
jgi:hypothetical protein